jgi:hypothetical protein
MLGGSSSIPLRTREDPGGAQHSHIVHLVLNNKPSETGSSSND